MAGYTSLGKKTSLDGTGLGGGGNANAFGPFGTALVSESRPTSQGAFIYSINTTQWITSSIGAGSQVIATEGLMSCSSGTSVSGSAGVRLLRSLKYRPGQGSICRLTSIFDTGKTDTLQLAGMGNEESGYYFAMSGSSFGILHREKSTREIRQFTITAPPAGAATLVVTLGGDQKSISINGGGSANQTSYQISQIDYSQVGSGWVAESIDGIVYFISKLSGPHAGTFSITNVGVSIATATTLQAGVLPTQTFVSQSSWNIDTMDGNGQSRFTLDPLKGNVYGIGYQYLGFGNSFFSIENPETGLLTACHMIKRAGNYSVTNIRNPHMTARWEAINSGSAATSVTVKGASAAVFTEGLIVRNIGPAFATAVDRIGAAVDIDTNLVPVLTLRANRIFQGQCNYGELDLFNISIGGDTGSNSSTTLLKIFIYKNAVLGGPVNFQHVDSTRSTAAVDTAATSISSNDRTQLVKSFIIGANQSITLKIEDENFFVAGGETITIAAQTNKLTTDASFSVSWFEDQ